MYETQGYPIDLAARAARARRRAEQRVETIDLDLVGLAHATHPGPERGVLLEAFAERVEEERLDEVVDHAALHRPAKGVHVLGRRDRDHVHRRRARLAKRAQDFEPADVGQVDVEEDEVRLEAPRELDRLPAGVSFADDLEAVHALDIRPVHRGGHVIVVHDERSDHRAASSRSWGRKAVKSAPSSFSTLT